MATTDIFEKISYCIDQIHRTLILTDHIGEDHYKRLIVRGIAIRLDDLIKLLPEWKNKLKNGRTSSSNITKLDDSIKKLSTDYKDTLERIRDEAAAHKISFGIREQYELFQRLQYSTLAVLRDDCIEIYELGCLCSNIRPVKFPTTALSDEEATNILTKTPIPTKVRCSTDDLAIGRERTAGIIHTGVFQQRAGQIVSLIESMELCITIANSMISSDDYWKDAVLQAATDCISLYDAIFTGNTDSQGNRIPPAIDAWNVSGCEPVIQELQILQNSINKADLDTIRNVRNKLGAHIDRILSFSALESMVNRSTLICLNRLKTVIVEHIPYAMEQAITLKSFLTHGQIIQGAVGVANDISLPFDDR